jgi:hypothetical protein
LAANSFELNKNADLFALNLIMFLLLKVEILMLSAITCEVMLVAGAEYAVRALCSLGALLAGAQGVATPRPLRRSLSPGSGRYRFPPTFCSFFA